MFTIFSVQQRFGAPNTVNHSSTRHGRMDLEINRTVVTIGKNLMKTKTNGLVTLYLYTFSRNKWHTEYCGVSSYPRYLINLIFYGCKRNLWRQSKEGYLLGYLLAANTIRLFQILLTCWILSYINSMFLINEMNFYWISLHF